MPCPCKRHYASSQYSYPLFCRVGDSMLSSIAFSPLLNDCYYSILLAPLLFPAASLLSLSSILSSPITKLLPLLLLGAPNLHNTQISCNLRMLPILHPASKHPLFYSITEPCCQTIGPRPCLGSTVAEEGKVHVALSAEDHRLVEVFQFAL